MVYRKSLERHPKHADSKFHLPHRLFGVANKANVSTISHCGSGFEFSIKRDKYRGKRFTYLSVVGNEVIREQFL